MSKKKSTKEKKTTPVVANAPKERKATFATLLEALNKYRGKGQQKVTVEHVHVHSGGQAVVGNVERPGSGDRTKSEE